MITSFGYVMLLTSNMNKSVEFYKKLLQKDPEFTSSRWSQFRIRDVLIALHAADSWSDENDPLRPFGPGQKGESFALWTSNLDEAVEKIKTLGIEIKYGPQMTGIGKLIQIVDPDGYHVQIVESLQK